MARKNVTKALELQALPPTTKEAFEQNIKRAHIQTAIWKSAPESEHRAKISCRFRMWTWRTH